MKNTIIVFSFVLLTGCRCGNEQELYKDNLFCYGTNYLGWGSGDYRLLRIGTADKPFYKSSFEFSIKLPSGAILKSTEFTKENIQKIKEIKTDRYPRVCADPSLEFLSEAEIYYYPCSTAYPSARCCWFAFKDSKIIYFDADAQDAEFRDEGISVYIGTISGDKFYKMPLTPKQIEEIFGKPDKIEAYWRP